MVTTASGLGQVWGRAVNCQQRVDFQFLSGFHEGERVPPPHARRPSSRCYALGSPRSPPLLSPDSRSADAQVGGHRSARVVAPPACGPIGSTSSEMLRDDCRDPLQVGPRPQRSQLRHVRRRETALQHPPHAGCKDFGPDDQSAEGILPRADRRVVDARPHELDVAAARRPDRRRTRPTPARS